MSDKSWWATAPREQFTAEAKKHLPQMETSDGAKQVRQMAYDSAGEQQDKNERKGGPWGRRSSQ